MIVEDEDFAKVKLKSTRVIEIEGFVNATEVHDTFQMRPITSDPMAMGAKNLRVIGSNFKGYWKVGVGRVVLRDRETPVLLTPEKNGILMYKFRPPEWSGGINEVPNYWKYSSWERATQAFNVCW